MGLLPCLLLCFFLRHLKTQFLFLQTKSYLHAPTDVCTKFLCTVVFLFHGVCTRIVFQKLALIRRTWPHNLTECICFVCLRAKGVGLQLSVLPSDFLRPPFLPLLLSGLEWLVVDGRRIPPSYTTSSQLRSLPLLPASFIFSFHPLFLPPSLLRGGGGRTIISVWRMETT